MNLTSKSMLQFMTVFASACALTATAQSTWVADTFEAPEGALNMPIFQYRMDLTTNMDLTVTTNNAYWTVPAGDASKLIAGAAADSGYAGVHPIVGAPQSLVLNLETEGQTLSRTTGALRDFSSSSVYVDTLIKFTPSEDTPVISDPNVKVAVYVNVNSNLVVYHRWATEDWGFIGPTNSVFAGIINPTNWYRLSIEMKYQPGIALPASRIYLDGRVLTNELTLTEGGVRGGEWFINANANDNTDLSAVAFQGTGAVDELNVSDIQPDFGSGAGILLTLVFDTSMVGVTTNGVAVANNDQVLTDTAIVITAKPWYELTAFGALFQGGDTTNIVAGTSMITNINGKVVGTAGQTNQIVAATYSATNSMVTGTGWGASYPANKVALWATTKAGGATDLTGMEDNYLFNVAPDQNATLQITSIVYDSVNEKAVITVGASLPAVNFTTLNGTLVVWTTDDLATPFALAGTYTIVTTGATTVTIDVPTTAGTFIKAIIQ